MGEKKPSKILDFLYLGGKSHAKSKGLLRSLNIKHILNVTPPRSVDPNAGCPNFFEKESGFSYKRVPIFDNRGEDLLAHLQSCCAFIDKGKHYGNVLVHCHKGVSRSASVIIGYLMKTQAMTFDEAFSYLKARRPEIQPNEAFESQLRQYETRLQESGELNSHEAKTSQMKHKSRQQAVSGPCIGPAGPPSAHMRKQAGPSFNATVESAVENEVVIGCSFPESSCMNQKEFQNINADSFQEAESVFEEFCNKEQQKFTQTTVILEKNASSYEQSAACEQVSYSACDNVPDDGPQIKKAKLSSNNVHGNQV